jgi:hypothetical protein
MRLTEICFYFSRSLLVKCRNQLQNLTAQINLHEEFNIPAKLLDASPAFMIRQRYVACLAVVQTG